MALRRRECAIFEKFADTLAFLGTEMLIGTRFCNLEGPHWRIVSLDSSAAFGEASVEQDDAASVCLMTKSRRSDVDMSKINLTISGASGSTSMKAVSISTLAKN